MFSNAQKIVFTANESYVIYWSVTKCMINDPVIAASNKKAA